ncbi:hypothetical protein [Endozoicomonas lisbonensis]|uniref:Uncharacterized protein n=1 Tax=Endozoicomonas lisbonensis TaxID=3120522 RepID=A0ABV2SRT7_9GAMM
MTADAINTVKNEISEQVTALNGLLVTLQEAQAAPGLLNPVQAIIKAMGVVTEGLTACQASETEACLGVARKLILQSEELHQVGHRWAELKRKGDQLANDCPQT